MFQTFELSKVRIVDVVKFEEVLVYMYASLFVIELKSLPIMVTLLEA